MNYERERRDRRYDRDEDAYLGGIQKGKLKRKIFNRRKTCRFCGDKEFKADYKNPKLLSLFLSERGRIIPRRISGACALHQRFLTTEVKRARSMALLPFTATQR